MSASPPPPLASTHAANPAAGSTTKADVAFMRHRERVCRWWPFWLLLGLAGLGAAAAWLVHFEPALATPLATINAAVLGELDPLVTQRLAALGVISVWAAFVALIGVLLVSIARQRTERRLLAVAQRQARV